VDTQRCGNLWQRGIASRKKAETFSRATKGRVATQRSRERFFLFCPNLPHSRTYEGTQACLYSRGPARHREKLAAFVACAV
jgi:hypothetical protein